MFRVNITARVAAAFIAAGAIVVFALGWLSYQGARSALEREAMAKLTAVREMKAQQVEGYFDLIRSQVSSLSSDPAVAESAELLIASFKSVDRDLATGPEQAAARDARLREYYRTELISRLVGSEFAGSGLRDLWPASAARTLQDLYLSSNTQPVGAKQLLDAADDGSPYSEAHERVHPSMRDFVERFGYYDLFIIDPDTGHIVYSVFKEADYGTSLLHGPYKDSRLASAFRAAAEATSADFVRLEDYRPYLPSYGAQASFIASPIYRDGKRVAVLALQMPVDRIDQVMTSGRRWAEVGLGESGETYLVGEDFTLRSQSRFLLEDRERYLSMIVSNGTAKEVAARIARFDSSIGLQEVRTEGTRAAISGESGTAIFADYRGELVLSSYRRLQLPDQTWAIMSEIDAAEAFAPAHELRVRIVQLSATLMLLFTLMSILVSRSLTRPLRDLTASAIKLGNGDLDESVSVVGNDEIGDLGRSLDAMRGSIRTLVGDLRESNESLEARIEERTADLELARSHMQKILESAADGVVVHDVRGAITLFNGEAERIFGYSAEEILGRPIHDLVPQTIRDAHVAKVDSFATGGASSRQMGGRMEIYGARKDGSEVPVEVGISRMESRGEVFMTAFVRDISERKAYEAKLRLQSTALASAGNGIFIASVDGTIEWVNPALLSMTGYSSEELIGKTPRVFKSGAHPDDFYEELWRKILGGETWKGELTNLRKDGSRYIQESIVAPVLDDAGAPVAFVAIQQDITQRKKLEADLAASFQTIKAQKARMEGELNVARDIQMSMLPLLFPAYPDRREFEVHARLLPAREVGGDFYDFFFIDDDRFFFCVGDVSDKGVPAALFMAVTKTLLKARSIDEFSTANIVNRVNDELAKENESCMFVTLFVAIIDLSTGVVTYTNAGHNRPYVRREGGSVELVDEIHGPAAGIVAGAEYGEGSVTLSPTDLLLMFTDGVTEAPNRAGDMFGESGVVRVLEDDRCVSTEMVVERIAAAVDDFQEGAELFDDTTLLAFRFVEGAERHSTRRLLKLRLQNDLSEVGRASDELAAFLEAFQIAPALGAKLGIALDELLNNIISYSYTDGRQHEIHVIVEIGATRLVLTISDDGKPFNALDIAEPDTSAPIEEREVGGLGLLLVRKLMDDVYYHRGIGRNVLTLIKTL